MCYKKKQVRSYFVLRCVVKIHRSKHKQWINALLVATTYICSSSYSDRMLTFSVTKWVQLSFCITYTRWNVFHRPFFDFVSFFYPFFDRFVLISFAKIGERDFFHRRWKSDHELVCSISRQDDVWFYNERMYSRLQVQARYFLASQ